MTLLFAILGCSDPAPAVPGGPPSRVTTTLIVAQQDLPAGQPIRESDLRAQITPSNYAPAGAIREAQQAVGRIPRFRVLAHEPLTARALVPRADAPPRTPADSLEEGHRGIAVPLGTAVVSTGQRVDVWWQPPSASRSCTVVQAVPVRDVNDAYAWLQVPADQALVVAQVARSSTVRLTVRAAEDREPDLETACTQ